MPRPRSVAQRGEGAGDLDVALSRARSATDGQKCALPTGTSLLMQSLILSFEREFRDHAGRPCHSHRDLVLPKIVDWDEEAGRFTYDAEVRPQAPRLDLRLRSRGRPEEPTSAPS